MPDNTVSVLPALKRTPWNKGKLTGAKPPLLQKHVWGIRTKSSNESAIWRCSIWPSTANCEAAMSLLSRSRTSLRTVIAPTWEAYARERPSAPFDLN